MHFRFALLTCLLAVACCASAAGQYHGPPQEWDAPCAEGQCQPNTFNYGFYQTHWRRWPTSLPRFEAATPSRRGGIESLPRVEIPDPRFEGDLSPPIENTNTPPLELPGPELPLPEPSGAVPRGSQLPLRPRVNEHLDQPPAPPLELSSQQPPRALPMMPREPAAFAASAEVQPLPPRQPVGALPSSSSEMRLVTHERPAVELRIVNRSPAPSAVEPAEFVIEELPDSKPPAAQLPSRVVQAPIRPVSAPPAKLRDQLFESLRATPAPR